VTPMAKRNPDWTRDELILALDLYVETSGALPSKTDPRVVELSELLNSLPIHPDRADERFRNPNGVAMKLGNFVRFDPNYHGAGLPRGNRLEEEVWAKFFDDPVRLGRTAEGIRQLGAVEHRAKVSRLVDDDDAPEGAILLREHKRRERSQRLVRKKKETSLAATGTLACEVCGFDFERFYGSVGAGFIECHHRKPLSELRPGSRTRLEDLALVCPNCHRMLHRMDDPSDLDQLRRLLDQERTAPGFR